LVKKYIEQGKINLLHGLSNKPSNHSIKRTLKERVLNLAKKKYFDFGPTLRSEYLEKEDKISVNPFTLRIWHYCPTKISKK
jgi:hypothetical protein